MILNQKELYEQTKLFTETNSDDNLNCLVEHFTALIYQTNPDVTLTQVMEAITRHIVTHTMEEMYCDNELAVDFGTESFDSVKMPKMPEIQ